MRGLIQATGDVPETWPRFLAIHLAGLRTADGDLPTRVPQQQERIDRGETVW